MQAIQTKFLPPTNMKGSRVKAWCDAGSLVVSYDYALNAPENHRHVAEALASKLGWTGQYYSSLIGGNLPSGGYAFVFTQGKGV